MVSPGRMSTLSANVWLGSLDKTTVLGSRGLPRWVMVTVLPAVGVKPPAWDIKSSNRLDVITGYTPGFPTSPSTETPWEAYSLIKTDTCGFFKISASLYL